MTDDHAQRLLTADELASALRVHVKTVRDMAAADTLPAPIKPVRIGRLLRFRPSELAAFLASTEPTEGVAA